jgi:hypothetical protein
MVTTETTQTRTLPNEPDADLIRIERRQQIETFHRIVERLLIPRNPGLRSRVLVSDSWARGLPSFSIESPPKRR